MKSSGYSQKLANVASSCARCLDVVDVFHAAPSAFAMVLHCLHQTFSVHFDVCNLPSESWSDTVRLHGKAVVNAVMANVGTAMKPASVSIGGSLHVMLISS